MAEIKSQGITRRDLLRKGAALGGALVWATPVVQTLGMGRAFAQNGTPVGPAISYIAMLIECEDDGDIHFVKWEVDLGIWEPDPGNTPGCDSTEGGIVETDYDVKGFAPHGAWPPPKKINDRCYEITVPTNCSIIRGVTKAGTDECTPFGASGVGPTTKDVGPGC